MTAKDEATRDGAVLAVLLEHIPAKVVAEFMEGHINEANAFERLDGWDNGLYVNDDTIQDYPGKYAAWARRAFPSRAKIGRLRNLIRRRKATKAEPADNVVPLRRPS